MLLLIFSFLLSGPASADQMTFVADRWCPFICDVNSKDKKGIMLDIAKEIFETKNRKVVFKDVPISRGLVEVRENRANAIVGVIPPVAPDFVYPEEPIFKTQFCFFTRPDSSWTFDGFDKRYPNIKVGIVAGKKVIDSHFESAFPNRENIFGDDDPVLRMVEILRLKRIDAFIDEKTVTRYSIGRNHLAPLRNAGCVQEGHEYLAFSPKGKQSKEYAKIFSEGMEKLKKSGRIDAIVQRYLGSE